MKKEIIPNALTSANFISGLFAVYIALDKPHLLHISGLLIIVSAIFDFFDGFVARLLKVTTDFGKQLDSFADALSFGIVPAFIIFRLLQNSCSNEFVPFVSFLIALFSVFRLAVFNITDQKYEFSGLPTPALALLVAGLPLSLEYKSLFGDIDFLSLLYSNCIFLVFTTVVFSSLLVSPIKMIALKFKSYKFTDNRNKFLLLIFSALLIIAIQFYALYWVIVLYVLFSIASNAMNKMQKQ